MWRLLLLTGVERPAENYEAVAGTGEHCVPGAGADSCGDGGPALQARLIFPKVLKTVRLRRWYIDKGIFNYFSVLPL